jgi:hypothetical protein
MASHPCRAVLRPRQHNDSVGSSELPRSSSLASVGCWLDVRVGPMPNSVHESVSSAVRGGRAVCALLCAAAPTDRDTGAPPRRRQVSVSQGTGCSGTLTASRPARSGSTRRPPSCGRGWRRWVLPRVAALTPTTGSRTCWASECTALIKSCPRISTRRSATRSAWAPIGCASSGSTRSTSSPGAPGWQLGLDVRGRGARRQDTSHQPQSVPPSDADRPHRDAADGTRLAGDERKMLLGIKGRAEHLASAQAT